MPSDVATVTTSWSTNAFSTQTSSACLTIFGLHTHMFSPRSTWPILSCMELGLQVPPPSLLASLCQTLSPPSFLMSTDHTSPSSALADTTAADRDDLVLHGGTLLPLLHSTAQSVQP